MRGFPTTRLAFVFYWHNGDQWADLTDGEELDAEHERMEKAGFTIDNEYIIARSYMDIPDEDGVIYIKNDNKTKIGDFIKCEITDTIEYDLVGKKIK